MIFLPPVTITARACVPRILLDLGYERPDWLLSLGDSMEGFPDGHEVIPPRRRLCLQLLDLERDWGPLPAPTEEDVQRIIDFCRRAAEGKLLVHCSAGVSRSSAAGLIFLAVRSGSAEEAVSQLFDCVEEALAKGLRPPVIGHAVAPEEEIYPNARIVSLADQLLGFRGQLVAALAARMKAGGVRWVG